MEHVQSALIEIRNHPQWLSEKPGESSWNGEIKPALNGLLAAHLGSYSMASLTATHNPVTGNLSKVHGGPPAIELF
jgi:hypothetical protein